jgi:hypothetical protein
MRQKPPAPKTVDRFHFGEVSAIIICEAKARGAQIGALQQKIRDANPVIHRSYGVETRCSEWPAIAAGWKKRRIHDARHRSCEAEIIPVCWFQGYFLFCIRH